MSNKRQDYIARVRYTNGLPAPPCPPKLLDIPVDRQKLISSTALSDLVHGETPNVDLDMDMGMPLDMSIVPGIFDREDESECYPLDPLPELDPRDSVLLKDPVSSGSATRGNLNVSFLRRTEYISSELVRHKFDKGPVKKVSQKIIGPEDQLRLVEDMFEAANKPLSKITHPTNKNLKPVASYTFLPDFKQLDLQYLIIHLVPSSTQTKINIPDDVKQTSLFRPTSLPTDEWMSFYSLGEKDAKKLKRRLDDLNDVPEEDAESEVYMYSHVRDYNMDLTQPDGPFRELVITFEEDNEGDDEEAAKVATFVSTVGRSNLKRRRVGDEQKQIVDRNSVKRLEMTLREVSAEESITRDTNRAQFDSVSYMAAPGSQQKA